MGLLSSCHVARRRHSRGGHVTSVVCMLLCCLSLHCTAVLPRTAQAKLQKCDLAPKDRKRIQAALSFVAWMPCLHCTQLAEDAVNMYYNLHVKHNKADSHCLVSERPGRRVCCLSVQTPRTRRWWSLPDGPCSSEPSS